MPDIKYIVGIDEAGRGPVAGPVAVGGVIAPADLFIQHEYFAKGVRDSKRLSLAKRERLFEWIQGHQEIRHSVALVSADDIDSDGIVPAINRAIAQVLFDLVGADASTTLVLLDGGIHAPDTYPQQATIVRGDTKEPLIALASVAAKVTRDAVMREYGVEYPQYGFEGHKGYGTAAHYKAIKMYGMCDLHRRSFLKGIATAV